MDKNPQMYLHVFWSRDGGTIADRLTRHDELRAHVGDVLETPLTRQEMQRITYAVKMEFASLMRQRVRRAKSERALTNKKARALKSSAKRAVRKVYIIDREENGGGGVSGYKTLACLPLEKALGTTPQAYGIRYKLFGLWPVINDTETGHDPLFWWSDNEEIWKPSAQEKIESLSKQARRALNYFVENDGLGALTTKEFPKSARAELEALGFLFYREYVHHNPHNYYPVSSSEFMSQARVLGIEMKRGGTNS